MPGKKAQHLEAAAGRRSTGTAGAHRQTCLKCYKKILLEAAAASNVKYLVNALNEYAKTVVCVRGRTLS